MTRVGKALSTFAAGVATFLVSLYGAFGEASYFIALAGLIAIVVGCAWVMLALRGARWSAPSAAVVAVSVAGLALHLYESTAKSAGFSIGFLGWSMMPYGLCLVVSMLAETRRPALAGAIVALLFDLFVHYEVYVAPKGSTAALALLFAPIWSTLLLAPVAMLVTWAIGRRHDAPV